MKFYHTFLPSIAFLLSILLLSDCRGDSKRPANVRENATFSRKYNGYALQSEGYEYVWYKDGRLVQKTQLNGLGVPDGIAERYEYKTGTLITKGQYKMGEKEGNWQWKYSNGKDYYELNFTPGVRKRKFWLPTLEWGNENGAYFRYFDNGRVNEKGFFDGGNKSGDWVKYYPDTKIEAKGSYLEDNKIGEWFYYYPDGRKEAVERYSDTGELQSRTTFYPNGSVWCETKKNLAAVCN
jgi:antitoxin component YwqK of YwqJK toxin-antitoxin module